MESGLKGACREASVPGSLLSFWDWSISAGYGAAFLQAVSKPASGDRI